MTEEMRLILTVRDSCNTNDGEEDLRKERRKKVEGIGAEI